MTITFQRSHNEADNIKTFYFKPEKPLAYTAGQFIEMTLPHSQPDDRGTKRWFTLSSSPHDNLLSITTKFAEKRRSSFKKGLLGLEPSDKLQISDPIGDFVLPKLTQTPLIFVAGGIGITPFHSILSWLAQTDEDRSIKLLYGVPDENEIIFLETFKKAGIHATIIVEAPSAAWGGERGPLTAEKILGLEQPSEDSLVYVSGPEPMVDKLKAELKTAGLNNRQIVTDAFPNYETT